MVARNGTISPLKYFIKNDIFIFMNVWDYDIKKADQNTEQFIVWKLERLINYGLGDEKINENLLKKYWDKIKMPENTRILFDFLLWGKHF